MSASPLTLDRLQHLVRQARAAGADGADALFVTSASLSLACRLGRRETLERAESQDLGLRVLVGRRQAVVSSSDVSDEAMRT